LPPVLLDTSALFAALDADDPNHRRARAFLDDTPAVYVVPETVFSEAMTLIKLHLGVALAVETGRAVLAGGPFRLHRLDPDDATETWSIFCRYADKEWSFTDCSVLALSRRMKLDRVFAFDHHFDQMASLGLRRVPGRRNAESGGVFGDR